MSHRRGAARAPLQMGRYGLVLVVVLVSLVSPGAAQGEAPRLPTVDGQVLATAVHPFQDAAPRSTADRVPLLEVFTATWCPPCAPADRAIERLLGERSPGLPGPPPADGGPARPAEGAIGLAVLSYHPWPDLGQEDPLGIPEGNDRLVSKYDAFWFPSVYVDGHLEDAPTTRSRAVDAGMEEVLYQSYANLLRRAEAIPPGFVLTTEWRQEEDLVVATVHVEAVAQVEGPLFVRGALWEDHVRFRGSNGIDDHRMTVRALTARAVVPALAVGANWTGSFEVRIPPQVAFEQAGLTFFVETAWGADADGAARSLMTFALGTAAAATLVVVVSRRDAVRRRPRRATPDEAPTAAAPAPETEGRP